MKKPLPLIAISLFICYSALSQASKPDEKMLTNDIGFNTYFIINPVLQFQSPGFPFDFLYKKQKSENKATRYGLRLGAFSSNEQEFPTQPYQQQMRLSLSPSLGIETQKPITGTRWMWYYGGDIVLDIWSDVSKTFLGDQKTQEVNNLVYGAGVRPFLGIRFNVNKQFYLATEASVNASYSRSHSKFETFGPPQTQSERISNYFSLGINPAAGLFLFYRF